MRAGRQQIVFRHPIDQIVIGLADGRARRADQIRDPHDLRHFPAAVVGKSPVQYFARTDHVAHGCQRFRQRRIRVRQMQIPQIEVVGAEPPQALVDGVHQPSPAKSAVHRAWADRVAHLAGKHPAPPSAGEQPADAKFGLPVGVGIRCVDEVDARVRGRRNNPRRLAVAGKVAEHQRAQAERRHFQRTQAEPPIVHRHQSEALAASTGTNLQLYALRVWNVVIVSWMCAISVADSLIRSCLANSASNVLTRTT